jgi:type I restriction enzyme M protein
MLLSQIFKNTNYDDTQFTDAERAAVESNITSKQVKGAEVAYITCLIRKKEIKLTPEEAVRQLFLYKLLNSYSYSATRISLESPIHFGREVKRADIVIWDKDRPTVPYIIVELKKPKLTDGKEQLKSYCNATGAPIGVWTNGNQISYYNRKDPNYFEDITNIPSATQKLADIINEQFTYADLEKIDKLQNEKKSLKDLILEMEDEVLANAGVDVFDVEKRHRAVAAVCLDHHVLDLVLVRFQRL